MSTLLAIPPATGEAVLASVAGLTDGFRERRTSTSEQRNVPAESIAELVNAGVARLLVPRERGGLDLRIRDLVEVVAAAAAGCPSTGWLAGLMAHGAHVVGRFPLEVQEKVWADGPDVIVTGSFAGAKAESVPGGFRVSGSSPFASGINNADWVYLGGVVNATGQRPEGAQGVPPEIRLFLVQRSQFTILDTWHTTGMRGTGSNTVVTEDVFVPEAFTLGHIDAREGTTPGSLVNANPTFRLPWVATGALVFSSAMLGATEGAYASVLASLVGKRAPNGLLTAESEVLQVQISFIAARIDTARKLLTAIADRADRDPVYTLQERATCMRDNTFAAMLLVESIDGLLEMSGTSGFGSTSLVQRAWRDVNFAAAHQGLNKRVAGGRYGRLALSVDDTNPPVFY